jgi:integrase
MPYSVLNNRKAKSLSTEEAGNSFLLHLCRFSSHTYKAYELVVKRFVKAVPKQISLITPEHIERFVLSKKVDYAPSSRNFHLAVLQSFFAWLDLNYDVRNVAKRVERLKALPPRQRVLSEEEYSKVMASTSDRARDCVQFLCMTGLRASEFLSLTPENISGEFLTVVGKGQKQRTIPLNETALSILKANPHLQFSKSRRRGKGHTCGRKWLLELCYKAAEAAKIPDFGPHACRHYFATTLYFSGVPLPTISKLLGHSSPTITAQIYIHWFNKDLIGTTDCLT